MYKKRHGWNQRIFPWNKGITRLPKKKKKTQKLFIKTLYPVSYTNTHTVKESLSKKL